MKLVFRVLRLGLIIVILWSGLTFFQAVRPARIATPLHPEELGWDYREFTVTTSDDIELSAWLIDSTNLEAESVVLVLHGYPADKNNLLGVAEWLRDDYDVMLIDFRYFGQSEGNITTLGLRESLDVQAAVNYLEKDYDRIGIYGFSMGGVAALSSLPLSPSVRAIVTDSAYNDLLSMTAHQFSFLGPASEAMTHLTFLWPRAIGLNAYDLNIVENAPETTIPILLLHNQQDQVVPIEQFEKLSETFLPKNERSAAKVFDGQHGNVDSAQYLEYVDYVKAFLLENI